MKHNCTSVASVFSLIKSGPDCWMRAGLRSKFNIRSTIFRNVVSEKDDNGKLPPWLFRSRADEEADVDLESRKTSSNFRNCSTRCRSGASAGAGNKFAVEIDNKLAEAKPNASTVSTISSTKGSRRNLPIE